MRKLYLIAALCTALAGLAAGCSQAPTPGSRSQEKADHLYTVKPLPPEERQRVLLLHSYHEEYVWLKNVNQGILQALAEERYLPGKNIEIDAFYMDTKRKTSAEWKMEVARKAIDKINAWNPHVVIASDDNAQSHVVSKMAGTDTPFVFLGVNADPMTYGYISSMEMPGGNITGCIERERFELSVNLLRQMVPEVSKIAVICDDGPTGRPVLERVRANAAAAGVSIVASAQIGKFSEWKRFVMDAQHKADALLVVVYHTLTDDDGNHVDADEVLHWTVSNSRLPDIGFWKWAVEGGLLCSEAISGYQQGHFAGTVASYVLAGQSPGEFAVQMPRRGEICINKARAESLGLSIPADLMKSATIFDVIQSAG
jgi:ABC-type uncharacterized transport system substrate-binding protein